MTQSYKQQAEKILKTFWKNDPYIEAALAQLNQLHEAEVVAERQDEVNMTFLRLILTAPYKNFFGIDTQQAKLLVRYLESRIKDLKEEAQLQPSEEKKTTAHTEYGKGYNAAITDQ